MNEKDFFLTFANFFNQPVCKNEIRILCIFPLNKLKKKIPFFCREVIEILKFFSYSELRHIPISYIKSLFKITAIENDLLLA